MDRDSAGAAVAVEDLWRGYGRARVLRGVTLTVPTGSGIAILGTNGSGKTTLLRCLAALLRPSRGRVRVCGEDPWVDLEVRRKIGFVGHEPMLYGGLSVLENLQLFATLHGIPRGRARAEEVCDRLRLAGREEPVRVLSRGMLQRAAFARAILHDPAVLLLDEVLSGLDLEAAEGVCEFLHAFRREGGTIVLATHRPEDALHVAGLACVLAQGILSEPRVLDGMSAAALAHWYLAAPRRGAS